MVSIECIHKGYVPVEELRQAELRIAELEADRKGWIKANGPGGWIDDLRVSHGRLRKEFQALLDYTEQNTCLHEETVRGGTIWEICNACGCKWADDEGGMPRQPGEWPPEIERAQEALAAGQEYIKPTAPEPEWVEFVPSASNPVREGDQAKHIRAKTGWMECVASVGRQSAISHLVIYRRRATPDQLST